jgi:hypothetical protein
MGRKPGILLLLLSLLTVAFLVAEQLSRSLLPVVRLATATATATVSSTSPVPPKQREQVVPLTELTNTVPEVSCGLAVVSGGTTTGKKKATVPPLVLVQDRIIGTQTNGDSSTSSRNSNSSSSSSPSFHTSRTIPRKLHVTTKSRCVVPEFAATAQLWKDALPDHSLYLHNDAAVDRLLLLQSVQQQQQQHPTMLWPALPYALHCVNTAAGKADIWRAVILYQ